jgi:hypothetical protein
MEVHYIECSCSTKYSTLGLCSSAFVWVCFKVQTVTWEDIFWGVPLSPYVQTVIASAMNS